MPSEFFSLVSFKCVFFVFLMFFSKLYVMMIDGDVCEHVKAWHIVKKNDSDAEERDPIERFTCEFW